VCVDKQSLKGFDEVPKPVSLIRIAINYKLPSNQRWSSEIRPPTGSLAFGITVDVGSIALIFCERLDVANENDRVIIAANAMRIKVLVFISSNF
jgi:hypothetical protein